MIPKTHARRRAGSVGRLQHSQQVLTVGVLAHRLRDPLDVVAADVAHAIGDFLDAADHQPLALFDGLHELRGLEQRLVRAGVEPGDAAPELFDRERAPSEIVAVDVGNFELAAGLRAKRRGHVQHPIVVEVEAGHRVARARSGGLLLDADSFSRRIERHHAVTGLINEYRRAG